MHSKGGTVGKTNGKRTGGKANTVDTGKSKGGKANTVGKVKSKGQDNNKKVKDTTITNQAERVQKPTAKRSGKSIVSPMRQALGARWLLAIDNGQANAEAPTTESTTAAATEPPTAADIPAAATALAAVKEDYLGGPAHGCRYWQNAVAPAALWLDGVGAL